jgi:hypothetical protein
VVVSEKDAIPPPPMGLMFSHTHCWRADHTHLATPPWPHPLGHTHHHRYNCDQASILGYNLSQMMELMTNCPMSCGLCATTRAPTISTTDATHVTEGGTDLAQSDANGSSSVDFTGERKREGTV